MKFYKKWLSVLLALAIFVGSFGLLPAKSEAATGSYIETALTKNGTTVTLKVNLRNYYYLSNGKFVVKYDKNVLQLRDVQKGTGTYASFDIQEVNTATAGEVVYGFASAAASYKYNTLLTVNFDVKNVTEQSTTVTTQIAELVNAGTHYTAGETTLSDSITVGTAAPAPTTYHTVRFYANNATYASQQVANGGYATEPTPPTRSGYTFAGWYLDSSTKYDFNTPVTSSFTLYAGWRQNTVTNYTVTFYNQGSVYTTQTVASGSYATQPTSPTRSGYTFSGWYTSSALTTKYNFNTPVTSNLSLYAGWTQNQSSSIATPTITSVSKSSSWYYGNRALIQWTSVSGAYGYEVYRATTEYGTYSYITTVSYSNYAYDSTAKSGTTYYYRVRAYKYEGNTKVYSDISNAYSFRM